MIWYNMNSGRKTTHYDFTVELINEMTQEIPRFNNHTADPTLAVRKHGLQYPKPIPPSATEATAQRNWHVCSRQRKRKRKIVDDEKNVYPPRLNYIYIWVQRLWGCSAVCRSLIWGLSSSWVRGVQIRRKSRPFWSSIKMKKVDTNCSRPPVLRLHQSMVLCVRF